MRHSVVTIARDIGSAVSSPSGSEAKPGAPRAFVHHERTYEHANLDGLPLFTQKSRPFMP